MYVANSYLKSSTYRSDNALAISIKVCLSQKSFQKARILSQRRLLSSTSYYIINLKVGSSRIATRVLSRVLRLSGLVLRAITSTHDIFIRKNISEVIQKCRKRLKSRTKVKLQYVVRRWISDVEGQILREVKHLVYQQLSELNTRKQQKIQVYVSRIAKL